MTCSCKHTLTDRDLPQINRIMATFWQAKYFEALVELQKANKGAARLRRKLDRLQDKAGDSRDG